MLDPYLRVLSQIRSLASRRGTAFLSPLWLPQFAEAPRSVDIHHVEPNGAHVHVCRRLDGSALWIVSLPNGASISMELSSFFMHKLKESILCHTWL